jgi:L-ascorbate metabolism protein UlaG (beta-lactamase superfamily)
MVQLHFYGHSCFEIQGEKARIIVDPWLRGNPQGC